MIKKWNITILIILILILSLTTISLGISGDLNEFKPQISQDEDVSDITRIGGIALATIRVISVIGCVLGIAILGTKIMFGSIEEKAEYQQKIIPFLIGCVIFLSSTFIVEGINNAINASHSIPGGSGGGGLVHVKD